MVTAPFDDKIDNCINKKSITRIDRKGLKLIIASKNYEDEIEIIFRIKKLCALNN